MFKAKKHHDDHMDETWLIPYADLLTLLLALFIVLFAMSEIDSKKVQKFAQAFTVAFNGGTGVLDYISPVKPLEEVSEVLDKQKLSQEDIKKSLEYQKETVKLGELKVKLDQYIAENNLSAVFETKLTEIGLQITIQDQALFNSGSAEILPKSREIALQISKLLEEASPREVTIAGHTDNRPIHNAEFESNWDLSAERALNFMKVLLENPNLDPATFRTTAYGEYRPKATNDTPEGRALNRRVEITIERIYH